MVIIGDVLVEKIIEKVIDVGFSYMADQCARQTGMKAELEKLNNALPSIRAVVEAADNGWTVEQQTAHPHLQAWLQQLKDALYEADDALDELEYLRLQKQVEADDDDGRDEDHNKVRHCFSNSKQSIIKFGKRFFKPDPTLKSLREAVKKLDAVAVQVGVFEKLVSNVQQMQHQQHQSWTMTSRATGSLVTEIKVFGRDSEKEELVQWLMKGQRNHGEENNVSLYSVVGLGGMGKTTLAQLVYNDENVQKSFDLKMWVCVSTSFDVVRITAAMLESATTKKPEFENLDTLQVALKDKLMSSNKFLLVLDDVWNDDNCSDWDKLLAPLRHGPKGSKILLTTRMDKVARAAGLAMDGSTKESMKLNPIHKDEFLSLFNRYAFAGTSSGDYKELHPIGMQIAKRLGRSPLAAKIIGALLNSNLDERYWSNILNCKSISDQGQQREGNIKSILMLSYHHLPPYLRPCFAFCSTFPQDHWFNKEDLVLKWMALGLIQHSTQNHGQEPEDIGRCYFDELFNRSFFEQMENSSSYKMHDLLHDVAHSVSNGECFSIVNNDKSVEDIPNTVRHLFLDINNLNVLNVDMKVDKWQQLRSLQLRITSSVHPQQTEVLEVVFKSLKSVRILELKFEGDNMRVLPDVFGHLRHLRSLTIEKFVGELPASLFKLHNLKVLQLPNNGSTALPEKMKNLISLRHLKTSPVYLSDFNFPITRDNPHPVIARVRKLSSLQGLSISIRKERDYKIEELEGLNMIRRLQLQGLENVKSPEEASMAKLGNKEHLRVLTLEWKWSSDNDTQRNNLSMDEQEQILDCLQPHSNLKELSVVRYKGVNPAKWMDFELVNKLQRISLNDCFKLEHLPSFRKLPYLKDLHLKKMLLVKQLDCDCQHLEKLYLEDMEGLEELSQSDENSGQWCPHLQKLYIYNSPKISVLPSLSLSVRNMELNDVGLTTLPKLWLGSSSSSPSSLCWLSISGCRKLASLNKGLLLQQHYLTALKSLRINYCEMLVDFPASLQQLRALKTLKINNFPNLRLDPTVIDPTGNDEDFLPSSLQYLSIGFCAELEMSMPTLLNGALTSLSILSLEGMKLLPSSSVWRKLVSLDSLSIQNCEELMSLEFVNALQHLGRLTIGGCPKLVCTATTALQTGSILAIDRLVVDDPMLLLTEPFRSLTSLRELFITNCSKLEYISGQIEEWMLQRQTILNELHLCGASSLKSLPDSLQTFSSLKLLDLTGVDKLQSLPRLPSSVEHLYISGCNETLKDRCRKDEGADWPNINHIRYIQINYEIYQQ